MFSGVCSRGPDLTWENRHPQRTTVANTPQISCMFTLSALSSVLGSDSFVFKHNPLPLPPRHIVGHKTRRWAGFPCRKPSRGRETTTPVASELPSLCPSLHHSTRDSARATIRHNSLPRVCRIKHLFRCFSFFLFSRRRATRELADGKKQGSFSKVSRAGFSTIYSRRITGDSLGDSSGI